MANARLVPSRLRRTRPAPVLANLSTLPVGAFSFKERLLPYYHGPLITVRRAGDDAFITIGYNKWDNQLDITTLKQFCGSNDGFVRGVFDQTGGGFDLTQGTTGSQPQIYDGATQTMKRNAAGQIECVFSTTKRLFNAQSFGLSGDPALTTAFAGRCSSANVSAWSTGGTGTNQMWNGGLFNGTSHDLYIGIASSFRTFDEAEDPVNDHYHVMRKAASVTVSNYTMRQNGSDLSAVSTTGGGNSLNFTGTRRSALGSQDGSVTWVGGAVMLLHFNADLSGADLAIVEEALRRCVP